MKKLFFVAAMAIATLAVSAQSKVKPGTWSIQPKLGVTVTSVTNMKDFERLLSKIGTRTENQTNVGATFGGEVEYQVDNRFSVAAGVGYIMQGKQWNDYKEPTTGVEWKDIKLDLGYVNVPIVANYYILNGIAVKAGVQFAFMTNAKLKTTEKDGRLETKESLDVKNQFNTFDFSIPVGLSYEFDNHIVIDARYNIDITNLNKAGVTSRNSVFLATVGYKFRL